MDGPGVSRRARPLSAVGTHLLGVLLGATVGTVGSFAQAWGVAGLLPSLAVLVCSVALVRVATGSRTGPVLLLLAWFAAVAVLSLRGPGGDVVLTSGAVSTAWLYAGVLAGSVTAVASGLPWRHDTADMGGAHRGGGQADPSEGQ